MNDLAVEVKSLNCGIDIDRCNVSILLYADDIVLLSPDEPSLQQMLDVIASWYKKWRMYINTDTTQIVHYRAQRQLYTKYIFTLDGTQLDIVQAYRYLGVILDEHLSFLPNAEALSAASSRALGLIRYKLKFLKECRSTTFARLFISYVCPISDYGAGVWGTTSFGYLSKYSDGPYVIFWDFIVLLQ